MDESSEFPNLKGIDPTYTPPSYGNEKALSSHLADPITTDNIAEALRSLGNENIDPSDTTDQLGIFHHENRASARRAGVFLNGILEHVLSLEHGISQGVQSFAPLDKISRQADPEQAQRREEADRRSLGQLASFLSTILYYPPSADERYQLLTYQGEIERNGSSRKARLPRYSCSSTTQIYRSDSPDNGRSPGTASSYKFDKPADVMWRVRNNQTGQTLVLDFFPLPYTAYEGRTNARYNGSSSQAAASLMRTHAVHQRDLSAIASSIETAEENQIKPSLRIHLEDADGSEIAALDGTLIQNRSNQGYGIDLFSTDFPEVTTVVPLQKPSPTHSEEDSVLNHNIPFRQVITDLAGLEVKEISPHKAVRAQPAVSTPQTVGIK